VEKNLQINAKKNNKIFSYLVVDSSKGWRVTSLYHGDVGRYKKREKAVKVARDLLVAMGYTLTTEKEF